MNPSCDRLKFWLRRIALFVRDYVDEFPMVWSLTRARDCERWGGHYWGPVEPSELLGGYARECSGCGTSESVSPTNYTGFLQVPAHTTTVNSTSWTWGQQA